MGFICTANDNIFLDDRFQTESHLQYSIFLLLDSIISYWTSPRLVSGQRSPGIPEVPIPMPEGDVRRGFVVASHRSFHRCMQATITPVSNGRLMETHDERYTIFVLVLGGNFTPVRSC